MKGVICQPADLWYIIGCGQSWGSIDCSFWPRTCSFEVKRQSWTYLQFVDIVQHLRGVHLLFRSMFVNC